MQPELSWKPTQLLTVFIINHNMFQGAACWATVGNANVIDLVGNLCDKGNNLKKKRKIKD